MNAIDHTEPVTGMTFIRVTGGTFALGDLFGDGFPDERPNREVTVGDFLLASLPVTQGQWQRVMRGNPSMFKKGPDYPVEMMSWDMAQDFIGRLNAAGDGKYRLPSEAEWEFAAREGGRKLKWSGTSEREHLGEYAWFDENANGRTHPVGLKKPNALGFYDMSGLTHEWNADFYHPVCFAQHAHGDVNPVCTVQGQYRGFRGGSWKRHPEGLRCSRRMGGMPHLGFGTYGLRLARDV